MRTTLHEAQSLRTPGTLGEHDPILLTGVSGFVDAVGFLTLSKLFVANMSGNSVALGIAVAEGGGGSVLPKGLAVVFFVSGLIFSRLWAGSRFALGDRRKVLVLYGLESLLLIVWMLIVRFSISPSSTLLPITAIGALAMGIQNAATTHFGTLTARTTHVTGLITEMADHLAQGFGAPRPERRAHLRRGALLFVIWSGYCVGATAGAYLLARIGIGCLGIASLLLLLLIAVKL